MLRPSSSSMQRRLVLGLMVPLVGLCANAAIAQDSPRQARAGEPPERRVHVFYGATLSLRWLRDVVSDVSDVPVRMRTVPIHEADAGAGRSVVVQPKNLAIDNLLGFPILTGGVGLYRDAWPVSVRFGADLVMQPS